MLPTVTFRLTFAQPTPGTPTNTGGNEKPSKSTAPATGDTGTPGTPGTPTTGTPSAPGAQPQTQKPGGMFDNTFLIVLFVGLLLMIVFSMRAQKREKKKRETLLESLKKGDKIQTIGGILGTVLEVRPDRVLVKVDENNNTRISFARSAIQGVVGDPPADEKKEPESEKGK